MQTAHRPPGQTVSGVASERGAMNDLVHDGVRVALELFNSWEHVPTSTAPSKHTDSDR